MALTSKRLSELATDPVLQGDELLYLAQDGQAYQVTLAALVLHIGAQLRLAGAPVLAGSLPVEGDVLTIAQGVWTPVSRERLTDGGTF